MIDPDQIIDEINARIAVMTPMERAHRSLELGRKEEELLRLLPPHRLYTKHVQDCISRTQGYNLECERLIATGEGLVLNG